MEHEIFSVRQQAANFPFPELDKSCAQRCTTSYPVYFRSILILLIKIHDQCSSVNISLIQLGRKTWALRFAHKEKREMHTGLSLDGLKEGDNLEHPAVKGRIILKYILIEKDVRSWIGLIHLWLGFIGVLMKIVMKVWCI
jgi:hypothetical protein